jgi:hypothetical protein
MPCPSFTFNVQVQELCLSRAGDGRAPTPRLRSCTGCCRAPAATAKSGPDFAGRYLGGFACKSPPSTAAAISGVIKGYFGRPRNDYFGPNILLAPKASIDAEQACQLVVRSGETNPEYHKPSRRPPARSSS